MVKPSRPKRDRELARAFGQRLQKARRYAGLSQLELSAATGVSTPFISGLERGVRQPSLSTLVKLAGGLGVGVADLVVGLDQGEEPNAVETMKIIILLRKMTAVEARRAVGVIETLAK